MRYGWLGGLAFAVHPLDVESVAWISELKNTLSLPRLLGAFLFYLDYDEWRRPCALILAAALFFAALLCKTSVVMFPPTLLAYAWWQRGRIRARDIKAAAPFFVFTQALALATLWFQYHRALDATGTGFDPVGGFWPRIACAGSPVAFYFLKSVAPFNLMPIYPQWPVNPAPIRLLLVWPALGALRFWFWVRRGSSGRHALFGGGWFLLHLAPVAGFVPISSQRFTWVTDHLASVPLLGIVGLAAAGLDGAATFFGPRAQRRLEVTNLAPCGVLALASRRHAADFQAEETLWLHNPEHNPEAWMVLHNLGNINGHAGRPVAAIAFYHRALQVHPNYPEAANNRGNELSKSGRIAEAIAVY